MIQLFILQKSSLETSCGHRQIRIEIFRKPLVTNKYSDDGCARTVGSLFSIDLRSLV